MNRAQAAAVMSRLASSAKSASSSTPASSIPADALQLTSSNVEMRGGDVSYKDGAFVMENLGVWDNYSSLHINNAGYSKLTLTVATRDVKHSVTVGGSRRLGQSGGIRLDELQDANTTQTYTADVSGIQDIIVYVRSGTTSLCTISNIYLYN